MTAEKKEETLGRRERKKRELREALESTALRLFRRQGYDETTIQDITDAVDVSVRTFFRYFDSKEAVLFADWQKYAQSSYNLIVSRPPQEPPLIALFEAAKALVEIDKENEDRLRLIQKLASKSRKIGDYERNVIYPEFERMIARGLAERMGVDERKDPRPVLAAAMATAAWTTARRLWMASGGKLSMIELLGMAFDLVYQISAKPPEEKKGRGRRRE